MVPMKYELVGEEDYALKIRIAGAGDYVVESGTYATEEPRKGALTPAQETELIDAVKALGLPREHPVPEGANAFEAHLTVGRPGEEVEYAFWMGALEEDADLNKLIRLLEKL